MAKGSKFGALAEFRREKAEDASPDDTSVSAAAGVVATAPEPEPATVAQPAAVPAVVEPEAKRRGRPPGKRSDPEWKLFSHFLKRKTQRRATLLITNLDDGRDLSDVLDDLLERWVEEQEKH